MSVVFVTLHYVYILDCTIGIIYAVCIHYTASRVGELVSRKQPNYSKHRILLHCLLLLLCSFYKVPKRLYFRKKLR